MWFHAEADWAAWLPGHLPGGPVDPPAWWAAASNVAGGSGMGEEVREPLAREGGLSTDKLFAGAFRVPVVTPLLMGPVCLLSRDPFEEPVHPWFHDFEAACIIT